MDQPIHLPKLVALILGCEAAGAITGIATREGITTWYRTLEKPSFTRRMRSSGRSGRCSMD